MKNQNPLLILLLIAVLVDSCVVTRFSHKPSEFDDKVLNISAHIDTSVKAFPQTYFNSMQIKNAIGDDISQVFSEVRTFEDQRDIDVLVIIHELRLRRSFIGILWFPLCYFFGAPCWKITGIAKLEVQIYNHSNESLISSYAKKAEAVRWTYYLNFSSTMALSMAVNSVMDEMKNAMIQDKALRSIEKESD